MPVSSLDARALAGLTPAALADLALSADQEARRLRKAGRPLEAAVYDSESIALAKLYRERN